MITVEERKIEFDKAIGHLTDQLARVRTGRANTSIVSSLMIEVYGSHTPLEQLGTVASPEPMQVTVQPWDQAIVKDVEKSIMSSDIGASVSIEGNLIRLSFQPLTEEKRKELVKAVGKITEDARIAVRSVRETAIKAARAAEKSGNLSKDEIFDIEKVIQGEVDTLNAKIKELSDAKESEVMTV